MIDEYPDFGGGMAVWRPQHPELADMLHMRIQDPLQTPLRDILMNHEIRQTGDAHSVHSRVADGFDRRADQPGRQTWLRRALLADQRPRLKLAGGMEGMPQAGVLRQIGR